MSWPTRSLIVICLPAAAWCQHRRRRRSARWNSQPAIRLLFMTRAQIAERIGVSQMQVSQLLNTPMSVRVSSVRFRGFGG
ncbi:hypothetical protein BJ964_006520 [Actinoplanes lobatus]|uniref:Uncharacterized protein n=1 Tax=Actinoplanes lobatus TaxID=113568 RepID=A0A7W7MJA4_9ACTN|nr:hypothetical protein [Actinoplanes lobatus]